MSSALEFSSVTARRLLLLHRLRVLHLLTSLPSRTRRELLSDLDDHLAEVLDHIEIDDEHERLTAALKRLGDPKEFLAPLIGDALFRSATSQSNFVSMASNIVALAMSGAKNLVLLGINLILGFVASMMILFCLTVLTRSGKAGIFQIGPDSYQARIIGWPTDDPSLLPAWGAVLIGLAGAAIVYFVLRWMRRAAIALIAQTLPPPDPSSGDRGDR